MIVSPLTGNESRHLLIARLAAFQDKRRHLGDSAHREKEREREIQVPTQVYVYPSI